jgi:transglutaminase-like putative cysteine protease
MRIRCGYQIAFDCPNPTPMLLLVRIHPSRRPDLLTPEHIEYLPALGMSEYIDRFGNCCTRILAPAGRTTFRSQFIVADTGLLDVHNPHARQIPVEWLPEEKLMYLLGSRYCETDRLSDIAWSLFGNTPLGYGRVQAIVEFVHNHIRFDYQQARPTRTAYDAYIERVGVCRDFAHLAVTFCRCMNIPARYCTGYLGDIGVPISPDPMDFSAWFEVFLDGAWYTFDARHNRARIGRVLMGRGRDATDVAIATCFGQNALAEFTVVTDQLPD